jgi:proteasome lid subunit RPN8/RPN11
VSAKTKLIISGNLLDEMISHCKGAYPLEACGILAGKDGVVQKVYKMTNIEHSSIRYQMESREQFRVMKEMRDQALDMVALYHSHPHSEAYPSPRDLRLAFYEEPFYVIVSLIHEKPLIKVFAIKDGAVTEVALHI